MAKFKVLTIDGGGIKGLYSATILRLMEEALQKNNPEAHLVDYVDMICGTSTGGLIALALALKVPARTVCEFYEKDGQKIFHGSQSLWAMLRQLFWGGKFSDQALRKALVDMYQGKTIGDSQCLLCIPTFNFTHGTYGIFKYDHKEGNLMRDNQLPMVDVALATSAAPTFFPLAQIKLRNDAQYVDGGVWANNPSLIGFTEAMRYFVGEGKAFDCLHLLSIASLNPRMGHPPLLKRRRSFVQWRSDLFEVGLIGQSEFADVFLNFWEAQKKSPLIYKRIPGPEICGNQVGYIQLDLATPQSFALMKQFAETAYFQVRMDEKITGFFQEPKLYKVK